MQEKIIEKIRKLVALGTNGGATEGERENAMRMAHALLAKHNLDESDLATAEEREKRILSSVIEYKARWVGVSAAGIAELFFCKVFTTKIPANYTGKNAGKKCIYTFVGLESNVETAKLMLSWIIKSVMKEQRNGKWNESFCIGAGSRIQIRCMEISQARKPISEGRGLMVIDMHDDERAKNDQFLKDMEIDLVKAKERKQNLDYTSYQAGSEFGSKIQLNTQLENDPGDRQLSIS